MKTDLSYIHPTRCYIYIKGYSLRYLVYNSNFETILGLLFNKNRLYIIKSIMEQLREEYQINEIKEKLNYENNDFEKILVINMENCEGIGFKLSLIKQIFPIKTLDEMYFTIDEYIKNEMSRRLNISEKAVRCIKRYKDHAELYCRGHLGPYKNHYIELSRELYLYIGKKYDEIDTELMEWDRYVRIKKSLYPQKEIYITSLLKNKLPTDSVIELLTYAYLPLTLAYIMEASSLEDPPTNIVYEGRLGVENLK